MQASQRIKRGGLIIFKQHLIISYGNCSSSFTRTYRTDMCQLSCKTAKKLLSPSSGVTRKSMQSNEEEVGGSAGLEWRKASGKSPARDQSAIVQYKRWLRWKTRSAMVGGGVGGRNGKERKWQRQDNGKA